MVKYIIPYVYIGVKRTLKDGSSNIILLSMDVKHQRYILTIVFKIKIAQQKYSTMYIMTFPLHLLLNLAYSICNIYGDSTTL